MDDLRIAILGTGRIGSMHARLLHHRVAGIQVAAVYDASTEVAHAVGSELGLSVAPSPDAIFEDPSIGAVAICSSTDTHIDLLVDAASASKAIFCEKPLSLDLEEVDRGLEAIAASGAYLQIGFNRRFDPSHHGVREAVGSAAVGELHLVRISSRDPAPPPISYIDVSGGIFLDMTIHDFDMARFVTGSEVTEVYAKGDVLVDPAIGEAGDLDTAVVVLTHENRVITTIDNSRQAVYGYDQRVEAFGSGGVAWSSNPPVTETVIYDQRGGRLSPLPHPFSVRYEASYLAQWRDFVEAVRNGKPSPVNGHDGRASLVIGLAAWKSIRERRPVATAEIG